MFSRFFSHRIDPIALAEETGYEAGWQGLDNQNPYRHLSPEWTAYNWGYNQANDDVDEVYVWPTEEVWPYSELQ